MVDEKGLAEEVADKIGEYVRRSGGLRKMIDALKGDKELSANEQVQSGLADMDLLARYLKAMDAIDSVSFDLSLARGLDYYTGLIYEVITTSSGRSTQVGSVAAGGRYDNLVGRYGKQTVPCVGLSFGVDRVFTILDARQKKNTSDLKSEADVYVMAAGGKGFDGLLAERMEVARQLWDAGIEAEFTAKVKPKMLQQFNAAKEVPVAVILGQDEIEAGQVRLKDARAGDGDKVEKDRGRLVSRESLVQEVTSLLSKIALEEGQD